MMDQTTLLNVMQKLTEKWTESKRFLRFIAEHFIEDDCIYRASALTFTTLLAIVPLMAVGFAVLSSFPVFNQLAAPIQHFIFENFVPTTGQLIQQYLQELVTQVPKLSLVGVIFLFMVALLVMFTIEHAMNEIWRVNAARRGLSAFLLYWAILSLAPFLVGLSLAASSYILSAPFFETTRTFAIVGYLPFLFSLIGFTFLYVVVPNCQVRPLHGFYGAIVATLLFESAKVAFAYYLASYNTYQLLYGAFAVIPLFLAWIYWVWLITLLGAEVSYALSVHHQRRPGIPMDGFSHALLWLYKLQHAQLKGKGLTMTALINATPSAYAIDVGHMLTQLTRAHLINLTSDGHYWLCRDLSHLTLFELTQILPYRLPNFTELASHDEPITKRWHAHLQKANIELKDTLNINLEQLFCED